jgi:membrane-associated phospholipid phosphatase
LFFFRNFDAMKAIVLLTAMLLTCGQARAQVVDDGLQYVPLAAAVVLGNCGVEARHPLRERIAVAATAYTALTAVAGGLKLTVSERRPDDSDDKSFPSGHAARAFAGAEMVRSEYGWPWGIAAYTVAASVSVLRVAGDHHYVHDVLAGAAVGVLSARVAYWLLPIERQVFGWDVTATPSYDYATQTVGIALTIDVGH